MNDEIKKILDRLERIDHKEYICGFEFADSASFDEMARCFEERKKMANYITNLQQNYDNNINKYEELLEKYFNIQQRIDKAIEYIEHSNYDIIGRVCSFTKLLDILEGDSDE